MTTSLKASGETMSAVVKEGPGRENVVVREVPVGVVPPGFARLRVLATGICGTDVHIANDEYNYEAPVVMGHEVVGIVDSVGAVRDESWVGRRVVCETYFSACERCEMCRSGRRNLCNERRSIGSYEDGGFAQFLILPILNLHRAPDVVSDTACALFEPLACVAHCLMAVPRIQAASDVLVVGPGAMGLLSAQVALAHGARVVVAGLEKDAARLALAAQFGAETTTDVPPQESYDVVIECSGTGGGVRSVLRTARKGAQYVQMGIFGREVSLPMDDILYKELQVSSGFASTPPSWRAALSLAAERKVVLEPLVTRAVGLGDVARSLMNVGQGEDVKTVVLSSGEVLIN